MTAFARMDTKLFAERLKPTLKLKEKPIKNTFISFYDVWCIVWTRLLRFVSIIGNNNHVSRNLYFE